MFCFALNIFFFCFLNNNWGLFVCFAFLGVFSLFYISNKFRTYPFTVKDQLIISYSGLRGASSFSLAFLLPVNLFPRKNLFITATLVVIYFTVFIQVSVFLNVLLSQNQGDQVIPLGLHRCTRRNWIFWMSRALYFPLQMTQIL